VRSLYDLPFTGTKSRFASNRIAKYRPEWGDIGTTTEFSNSAAKAEADNQWQIIRAESTQYNKIFVNLGRRLKQAVECLV
jgi:hypothetical protein